MQRLHESNLDESDNYDAPDETDILGQASHINDGGMDELDVIMGGPKKGKK